MVEGAITSGGLYGIIARANRVEPFDYLRFVLGCMGRYQDADMPWEHLLPTATIRDFAAPFGSGGVAVDPGV